MFRNLNDKRPADQPQRTIWPTAALLLIAAVLLAAIMMFLMAGPLLSSQQDNGGGFQIDRYIEPGGNQGDGTTNSLWWPSSLYGLAVCVAGALVLGGTVFWLPEGQVKAGFA